MGITVKYECEKCGKIEEEKPGVSAQFWNIGYGLHHVNASGSTLLHKQLWCRECCEKIGILPASELKDKPEQIRELTIEDRLIEILEDLGFRQSE